MKTVQKTKQIKKIASLMVACVTLLLVLSSCSGDDAPSTPDSSIVGKWDYNKIGYIVNGIIVPDEDYQQNQPGCNKEYLRFKNDGFMNFGQHSSDCVLSPSSSVDFPWSQTTITLSLNPEVAEQSGVPVNWEIVSVSSTDLQIKGDMTGMEGVEPGVEFFMVLKFKKSAVQD